MLSSQAPLPPPPSWLHRWRPLPKVVGLLALMAAFAQVQRLALLPLVWVLVALLWALSGLPLRRGLRRLAAPGVLLIAFVLFLPFAVGETFLWQWGSLALRWEGLERALCLGGRSLALLALAMLLGETTPLPALLAALAGFGDPRPTPGTGLANPALFAGGGYPVAADAAGSSAEGAGDRGDPCGVPDLALRQDLPFLAAAVGTLLVRSYERSERVYQALRLTGLWKSTSAPRREGKEIPGAGQPRGWRWLSALGLVWFNLGVIPIELVGRGVRQGGQSSSPPLEAKPN
jgi:cobalt/nickel transport system permease protein